MNFLERQLEDPVCVARVKRWFYWCLAAIVLAEIIALLLILWSGHRPHVWFEWIPAFGSLYGLASCVAIIVVSKFLGKKWLMRREDYYDS